MKKMEMDIKKMFKFYVDVKRSGENRLVTRLHCVIVLRQDGLVVGMSASHVVGHGFVPWLGHTEDHHKNGTNCLPAWHAGFREGVWQCNPLSKSPGSGRNCLWEHVL